VSARPPIIGVDRSRLPGLRSVPRFVFPTVEKSVLANGLPDGPRAPQRYLRSLFASDLAGSAATVRQRLEEEVVKGLRVGNLMLLVQIGSMPHELTMKNISLLGRDVLPHLRGLWEDEGWVNHWWPEKLRKRAPQPAVVAAR
jgi:hypothetical protein